ncbi:MAG: ATP-binding protein, partial [Polyangiaceae bacterium]
PYLTMNDVIGTDFLAFMPPHERSAVQALFSTVLATGVSSTYESSIPTPSGEKLWFSTTMGPMRSGERITGVVLVAQEITELRRTQLQFAAAQRMAAVGTLAAGIAHEINTPIQFVGDSIQFLREGMQDLLTVVDKLEDVRRLVVEKSPSATIDVAIAAVAKAEAAADLPFLRENVPPAFERCIDGVGRVASIVQSVREFAHPAHREMVAVDLNRAITNTLTIARNEYAHVADLETDLGELSLVTCHVDQINQVVLNLVTNAAHAIDDVFKSSGIKGRLSVRTRMDGGNVVISVSDTGPGIPEAIRDRIFEPFFTTKDVGKGTGQGLALAWRQVTNNHGGTLRCETGVGKGTTFFVRLPAAGKPQAGTP